MEINFIIEGQSLLHSCGQIVSDSFRYISCKFKFSSDWNGVTKFIHFKQGFKVIDLMIINDEIPPETGLYLEAGRWDVYVHGNRIENGEVVQRITTDVNRILVEGSGIDKNGPFHISPSIGEQIVAEALSHVEEAREIAESIREYINDINSGAINSNTIEKNKAIFTLGGIDHGADVIPGEENDDTNYARTDFLESRFGNYTFNSKYKYDLFFYDSDKKIVAEWGFITGNNKLNEALILMHNPDDMPYVRILAQKIDGSAIDLDELTMEGYCVPTDWFSPRVEYLNNKINTVKDQIVSETKINNLINAKIEELKNDESGSEINDEIVREIVKEEIKDVSEGAEGTITGLLLKNRMHLAGTETIKVKNYSEKVVVNDFKRDYRKIIGGSWIWVSSEWFVKKSTDGSDIADNLPVLPVRNVTGLLIKYNFDYQDSYGLYQFYIPSLNQLWYQYISASGFLNAWKRVGHDDSKSHWYGKKWYAYGTSMTEYVNQTLSNGKKSEGYAKFLPDLSGLVLTNRGLAGSGIVPSLHNTSDNIKTRVMTLDDGKGDADLITVEIVPNDTGAVLGEITDTVDDTFCGNLNQMLEYLQKNTTSQIVVLIATRPRYKSSDSSNIYKLTGDVIQKHIRFETAVEKICEMYEIPCINANKGCGLTLNRCGESGGEYIADNIHLLAKGGKILAEYYWSKLKNIPLFA